MEILNFFAQDAQGNIMPSAECYLYAPGTTNLVSGLVDINGMPISNPFQASNIGKVQFGAPNGVYDLRIKKGVRDTTIRIQCADIVQAMDVMDSILGSNAENPTTRNNGQPLEPGDETWNSTDKQPYWWNGADWVALNSSAQQLEERLDSPTGSDMSGFIQQGSGAFARTVQDKLRDKVSVKDYGAIGDGAANDTSKFAALEVVFTNRIVDLQGKTYLVDARPIGNRYTNGFFKVGDRRLSADVARRQDLLYTYNTQLGWEVWPVGWTVQTYRASSAAVSRNTSPTLCFGSMTANASLEVRGFPYDFQPVAGSQLIQMTGYFSGSGGAADGAGFVVESFDVDGVATEVKLPFDYISTKWRKKAVQYRLPPRTREYRVGLYRLADASTGVVYFSRFVGAEALEPTAIIGGSQYNSMIDIKRDQTAVTKMGRLVRIGPSPTTAFQDFAQIKGTENLYFASGHEVVAGSGVDAMIVEKGARGTTVITSTEFQNPLAECTGHAGLSIQYYDDGTHRLWSGGTAPGTAVRFSYGGLPGGGDATNVEVFQLFDVAYNSSAYCAVSYDGCWMVAVGRANTSNQIVRLWRMEDLKVAGDYRNSFVHEWALPYEMVGDNYPMQGLACDGAAIYVLTGGHQAGTPGSIKLGQFTMAGEIIAIIRDVIVGAADYAADGAAWEPEGLDLYREGPFSTPHLAMGIVTGVGGTKKHTMWSLGSGGQTLLPDIVNVTKAGNLPGYTHNRNNSSHNCMNAVVTQAGTVYYGNPNGVGFCAGPNISVSGAYFVAYSTELSNGADNAGTCGSATRRFKELFSINGVINTSDLREKMDIIGIPDAVLDAVARVEFVQFRWKSDVAAKAAVGEDARIHSGIIAQQLRDSFLAEGVDPFRWGVLCFDEWPDTYDEDGHLITEAGNRYAIRYEELEILLMALSQRTAGRMQDTISALEQRLAALEA